MCSWPRLFIESKTVADFLKELTGIEAPADHHLDDLADLADRIGQWLQASSDPDPGREARARLQHWIGQLDDVDHGAAIRLYLLALPPQWRPGRRLELGPGVDDQCQVRVAICGTIRRK